MENTKESPVIREFILLLKNRVIHEKKLDYRTKCQKLICSTNTWTSTIDILFEKYYLWFIHHYMDIKATWSEAFKEVALFQLN